MKIVKKGEKANAEQIAKDLEDSLLNMTNNNLRTGQGYNLRQNTMWIISTENVLKILVTPYPWRSGFCWYE